MPFVKLDCGILNSTIWTDLDATRLFITALLMASPVEFSVPISTIEVDSLTESAFTVPPGWYGFVPAAGPGIVNRSGLYQEPGMAALRRLCSPEQESRTKDHQGRRMCRVDGGYVILNYMKYRDYDYSAAERMRKLRERRKELVRANVTPVHPNVTQEREQKADKQKTDKEKPTVASLPDWLPKDAWDAFLEMRKKLHKVPTERAKELLIEKLFKLRDKNGDDPREVLERSVMNGWQGIFELPKNRGNGNGQYKTATDEKWDAARAFLERIDESH